MNKQDEILIKGMYDELDKQRKEINKLWDALYKIQEIKQ